MRVAFAALKFADAFFEKAETFIETGDRLELQIDRASPIIEGSQHFRLHVTHALDKIVMLLANISTQPVKFRAEQMDVCLSGWFVVVVWHVTHIDD